MSVSIHWLKSLCYLVGSLLWELPGSMSVSIHWHKSFYYLVGSLS